jgi:hypothetical protein
LPSLSFNCFASFSASARSSSTRSSSTTCVANGHDETRWVDHDLLLLGALLVRRRQHFELLLELDDARGLRLEARARLQERLLLVFQLDFHHLRLLLHDREHGSSSPTALQR